MTLAYLSWDIEGGELDIDAMGPGYMRDGPRLAHNLRLAVEYFVSDTPEDRQVTRAQAIEELERIKLVVDSLITGLRVSPASKLQAV